MVNAVNNQQESAPTIVEDEHFPGLYQSADRSSISAQRRYIHIHRWHLFCLIFGSVCVAIATKFPVAATWTYVLLAIVLAIGIFLTLISRVRRDNEVWFDCRAIAESTKTATWRFMMKADPFKDDSTSEQSFLEKLRQIRGARPSSPKDLAQNLDANAQSVSGFMNEIRRKSVDERRNLYLESRLRDQKTWYSNKAIFNSRKENRWSWTVVVLQISAIAFAIIQACLSGLPLNVVPLLMTCAASAVAWSQMKRYSELAQTYSLAAQELGDQETIALHITEEADLINLVRQVEETISREHTLWCARRDVVFGPSDIADEQA
ncbi:MAG: DUF4231 domain-containing protein [Gemmatimonadetes bacterium]|nr:DUF4231 domain-containing protein [Gemmatimonadota bacterium]